jgi:coenzyme F420-dependent glucose-6-phosphate dehydrogenase
LRRLFTASEPSESQSEGAVIKVSYHVSHEQFSPRELIALARHAEAAGFDAAFSSDHIHPWSVRQKHSGFIWAWLGAAMQATDRLPFSGITVPGGWRYHPAVVAQAIATLGQMFPGRLPWFALGSGEALNESVVGTPWPSKQERNSRLRDGARIIRMLLAGERVSSEAEIPVENAQIWSRPDQPTLLMGAALSEETAGWVGKWADGLLTVASNLQRVKGIVGAFRRRGGQQPMHAKVDLSWAPAESQALRQACDQWRTHTLDRTTLGNARTPEELDRAARDVDPEKLREIVLISSDLDRHAEWLHERAALGFESLDLHNVGPNQHEFIEAFGSHVLPALRRFRPRAT